MEFSAHLLPSGPAPESQMINGLRLDFALPKQTVTFPAAGCLVLALRHTVNLQCGDVALLVPRGGAYFVPASQRMRFAVGADSPPSDAEQLGRETQTFSASADGLFIVMRATEVTWRALVEVMQRYSTQSLADQATRQMSLAMSDTAKMSLQPIAGLWSQTRLLGRVALRLVHQSRLGKLSLLDAQHLFQLSHAFEAALSNFADKVERCPGRGIGQKLQVFRRLMRVRQLMLLHCNQRLSIDQLAAHANYSRAHFLHIYRTVFAETPHAHLMEQRLHLAQHLLSERGLSVNETTLAAGFEDRSSFSKLFRRRFGHTALSARQAGVECFAKAK
jgi:AraC-like DNA-binding protein